MGSSGSGMYMVDENVEFFLILVAEVCEYNDADQSRSLSFDEWRDTEAIIVAGFSLAILEEFDADENGLIESAVR
jgi:hypothetical protein